MENNQTKRRITSGTTPPRHLHRHLCNDLGHRNTVDRSCPHPFLVESSIQHNCPHHNRTAQMDAHQVPACRSRPSAVRSPPHPTITKVWSPYPEKQRPPPVQETATPGPRKNGTNHTKRHRTPKDCRPPERSYKTGTGPRKYHPSHTRNKGGPRDRPREQGAGEHQPQEMSPHRRPTNTIPVHRRVEERGRPHQQRVVLHRRTKENSKIPRTLPDRKQK